MAGSFWLMITTLDSGKVAADDASCLQAIHSRHGYIHQHHGRPQSHRFFNAFDSVDCFAGDAPLRAGGKQGTKSAPDDLMIVHDEDVAKHQ